MKHLTLVALSVLALSVAVQPIAVHAQSAKASKSSSKTMTATGTVKSVAGNSVVVSSGGKDMTFTVDGSTKFTGKGLGTKTKAGGGKMSATDAVHDGDMVSVSYHDMGGTMHAASVRVTSAKAMK
jgi:hypothetical protein